MKEIELEIGLDARRFLKNRRGWLEKENRERREETGRGAGVHSTRKEQQEVLW